MFANFLFFVLLVSGAFCANVLYLETIPSPSHHIWNGKMALSLVEKGHNVTVLGPDNDNTKKENFTFIHMEGVYEEMAAGMDPLVDSINYSFYGMIQLVHTWITLGCTGMYKSKGLQKLLDYPEDYKFDLVIIDVSVGECLHPIIKRFNYPPTIGMSIYLLPTPLAFKLGNPIQAAYVPNHNVEASTVMTFSERVHNFFATYLDIYLLGRGTLIEDLSKQKFNMKKDDLNNVTRHVSIVLANVDPILSYPQPLLPNIINVGGLHAGIRKPIPKEFQKILDLAKNGVIIFSLGTNIHSADMDKTKIQAFLYAFAKLPYTILWKFEEELEDKPDNVIIKKWLPQGDIMGHPNVILFIGHGGALSSQEAIYHGIPSILVPFMLDQRVNAKIIQEKGVALTLDYKTLTEKDVTNAITEILGNPKYKNKMKQLSTAFRDKPLTPLETAHFWVNYMLKHKEAPGFSSIARDLPFFVLSSLDVTVFVSLFLILFLLILYKFVDMLRIGDKKSKKKTL